MPPLEADDGDEGPAVAIPDPVDILVSSLMPRFLVSGVIIFITLGVL
jgi:hypothetical protein